MGNNYSRKYTNKLISLAEEGVLDWEDIARCALDYMSDDDVGDLAVTNAWVDWQEEFPEDYIDDDPYGDNVDDEQVDYEETI